VSFASFGNFYTKSDYDPLGSKRVASGKQNIDTSELQLCDGVFNLCVVTKHNVT